MKRGRSGSRRTAAQWLAALVLLSIPALAETVVCIVGVTVIDPGSGAVLAGRTVSIEDGRITSVAADDGEDPLRCDRPIDGEALFLIPGLWDMHVHGTRRPSTWPLYVANGVTGVREMFGPENGRAARNEMERSEVVAPRLHTATPLFDGAPALMPGSVEITTIEAAREAVATYAGRGADFIKVYQRLPRDVYFEIMSESGRRGLAVAGHVPRSVTLWEAVAAGQATIEHLTPFPLACSTRSGELGARTVRSFEEAVAQQVEASRSHDSGRCALLWNAMRTNGTMVVPTLTAFRSDAFRETPEFQADERVRYFDADTRKWLAPRNDQGAVRSAEDRANALELFVAGRKLVAEMAAAGVRILAGSDTLNPYVFPGFSLHDELALLVESGLTPLQALQGATSSAAELMNAGDEYGAVAPGLRADLVLLRANPLEDIRHTTSIEAVILGGNVLDRAALDRILAEARSGAE